MNANNNPLPDRINEFVPGSFDTPLNTARMNQIVAVLNAFLAMRVGDGLILRKAEAGFLIELESDRIPVAEGDE